MTEIRALPEIKSEDCDQYDGQVVEPKRRFPLVRFDQIHLPTAPAYLVKGLIPRSGLVVVVVVGGHRLVHTHPGRGGGDQPAQQDQGETGHGSVREARWRGRSESD